MTWTKYYVVLFAASAVMCWIVAWRAIRKEQILNGFLLALVAPFILSGLLYVGSLVYVLVRDGI